MTKKTIVGGCEWRAHSAHARDIDRHFAIIVDKVVRNAGITSVEVLVAGPTRVFETLEIQHLLASELARRCCGVGSRQGRLKCEESGLFSAAVAPRSEDQAEVSTIDLAVTVEITKATRDRAVAPCSQDQTKVSAVDLAVTVEVALARGLFFRGAFFVAVGIEAAVVVVRRRLFNREFFTQVLEFDPFDTDDFRSGSTGRTRE